MDGNLDALSLISTYFLRIRSIKYRAQKSSASFVTLIHQYSTLRTQVEQNLPLRVKHSVEEHYVRFAHFPSCQVLVHLPSDRSAKRPNNILCSPDQINRKTQITFLFESSKQLHFNVADFSSNSQQNTL